MPRGGFCGDDEVELCGILGEILPRQVGRSTCATTCESGIKQKVKIRTKIVVREKIHATDIQLHFQINRMPVTFRC